MDELREIQVIAEYEGYSIEEAKLSYAARQDLPASAFCGPDKSYPAQDAAHCRAGFQRLSQFGKKMPRPIAMKIYRCLVRRAKRFGVEHDPKTFSWMMGNNVEETLAQDDIETKKVLTWLFKEIGSK
jgi:hypothetical protein